LLSRAGSSHSHINYGIDIAVLQNRRSSLANDRLTMASYHDGSVSGDPPAARVGADLRAARERLGWTLPAIAGHLRIRRAYLAALEDGRVGDLPAVVYALGFLRTYAEALGLDPDEMSRRFRAEVAEANRKTELNFPAPVPERGVPAGAVVLIGALLAIGAYAAWYRLSETSAPLADAVAPVPAQLAPLAEKVAPPPPAPATVPEPARPSLAAAVPALPPLPSVPPTSAAAAVAVPALLPPDPSPAAPTAPAPQPAAIAEAETTPAAPQVPAPHIVVHATADAWIQVRDKAGQVLLNRVLRGGESWVVPDRPSLLLTTGNAGGTELLVDGVATASLGNSGAVRRDLPLDGDAIKAGKLAPHAARTSSSH
jgi:cytoskeleton protein RodZ